MSGPTEATAPDGTGEIVALTYREAINAALHDEMAADPTVVFLGEDVAQAGGVFKTNDGLVERFGRERVRNTPICENTFVGVALGMAVTGLRPVVEIMFSDFLPTAGDAIVNEVPKFRFMSGGQFRVPLTVRSIGGGGGRFGTQHSATGESWYMALPGLRVVTAATPDSAYGLLRAAIRLDDPVLFIEHKALYTRKGAVRRGGATLPDVGGAAILRPGRDVTIVGSLLMVDRALAAAEALAAEGIEAEVIDIRWLNPLDVDGVAESVERTGRLVVAEEQHHEAGWGATLISQLAMAGVPLRARPRAASLVDDLPVPFSPSLEDAVIPSVGRIAESARLAVGE